MRNLRIALACFVVLLASFSAKPALADFPGQQPALSVCVITTSGNTTCKGTPGTLYEIINNSTSAQAAGNCQIFDGPTQRYIETTIAAGQIIHFGGTQGMAMGTSINVTCAVTPTANGLEVLYQ
jgi:hypothetical protein